MNKVISAAVVLAATLTATSSQAHHSRAMFDATKLVRLEGTVVAYQWTNPHVFIQVMAPGPTGKVEQWSLEGPAIAGLRQVGWDARTVKKGDKVTAQLFPLKSGGAGGAFFKVEVNGQALPQTQGQINLGRSGGIGY